MTRLDSEMTDAEWYASRPKPFRDDLEKKIVLSQDEIDAMEWTWGMGDFDRCLQNLELERRRLNGRIEALEKENAELANYKFMYESCSK